MSTRPLGDSHIGTSRVGNGVAIGADAEANVACDCRLTEGEFCGVDHCHDCAQPLPRPSRNSDPSLATPKLVAVPQLNSGCYINPQPRTSSIVSQPQARSNPGISDLSPSLDETLNLVRPLLAL